MPRKKQYPPIRRKTQFVPWGYEPDPEDPQLFRAIPDQLAALDKGRGYLREGCSFRQVADWLTASTGRPISHEGLRKLISARRKHGWFKRSTSAASQEGGDGEEEA